ncbi:MAG: T9SS type A sorting domain-containing protein [Saprospiraceae bacterium]|nr:T9SS type A sorting domain-containing protein [Saprospiraceae bacterium]
MKYIYLTISILISGYAIAQGPRYTVNPSPNTIYFVPDNTDHYKSGKVRNHTNEVLNILWTREILMMPAGWSTYVCDANNCYADKVGKCPEIYPNVIQPGDSTTLDVHVYEDGTMGEAHIVMWVYEAEDTSKKVKVDYTFNKVVSNKDIRNIAVKVYPNPASNSFTVDYNTGLVRIDLVNILGRKIRSFRAVPNSSYDISDLEDGMYFIRLIGPNDQNFRTLRLQKRAIKA